MNYECPFCHTFLEAELLHNTFADCKICSNAELRVTVGIDWVEYQWDTFTIDYYFNNDSIKCRIFLYPGMLDLDFLPNINPTNVKDWFNRFIKMKAFL